MGFKPACTNIDYRTDESGGQDKRSQHELNLNAPESFILSPVRWSGTQNMWGDVLSAAGPI